MGIKGYKAFNHDWTCKGFQYEVGKIYTFNGKIEPCKAGFHFCRELIDCLMYYPLEDSKFAEIEALGDTIDESGKTVTNKIKIIREIPIEEVLKVIKCDKNSAFFWNLKPTNLGSYNYGQYNIGSHNNGNFNNGSFNRGKYNIGDFNIGHKNSGNCNLGHLNRGFKNLGDGNYGNYNEGTSNFGSYNKTSNAFGFFNTQPTTVRLFNKSTNLTMEEVRELPGIFILNQLNCIGLVDTTPSTPQDFVNAEYYTRARFDIRRQNVQEEWNNLSDKQKQYVLDLPNFDPEIFKEITGIDVNKKED